MDPAAFQEPLGRPHSAYGARRRREPSNGSSMDNCSSMAAPAESAALMADRNCEPSRWEDVPPAAYLPWSRLKAMDAAGIDYSVLYPTVAGLAGETFGRLEDPELELAVQAYNDWLIEEWASASDRFIPQCIVPIGPVESTVAEIRRAVANGHRGVVFPSLPMHLRAVPHVSGPEYDPVWNICEELNVPVCLHAGASPELQYEPFAGLKPALAEALNSVTRPVSSVFVISLYSFSRVLLRHPHLRVVLAESALSWGMLYMEWADHQFDHDGLAREGYQLKPSEMFHRQCFLTVVRRGCAVCRLRRRGEYSLVYQFSFGDFELAAHRGNHRALFPERPGGGPRKAAMEKRGVTLPTLIEPSSDPRVTGCPTLSAPGAGNSSRHISPAAAVFL